MNKFWKLLLIAGAVLVGLWIAEAVAFNYVWDHFR
jgi:hypothetical protein